jgi:hypothetical protein
METKSSLLSNGIPGLSSGRFFPTDYSMPIDERRM